MRVVNRREVLIAAAIPGILLLTYWVSKAALSGPFIFDDYPNLGNLALLAGVIDAPHIADYLQAFIGNPGRPLAALSFLIDDFAWPSSPESFKRTNLLLHLLIGVLIFGLSQSLARARLSGDWPQIAALLASGTWLLHPMQLSTSMLVVQRMTQLMTLITIATVWWASSYVQRRPLTTQRSLSLLAVTAIATVAAFLCKENGALLPLYVGVTSFVLLRPTFATNLSRQVLQCGLYLPIVAVLMGVTWAAITYIPDGVRTFSPGERLITQPRILVEYLFRIALPRLSGSGLFHDDYVASRSLLDPATTLPAIVLCLSLIGAALAWRRRLPLFSFATLWFFGGHLMESSALPLELYFEHRNYLPMVGLLVATAISLASLSASNLRRILFGAAVVWLILCGAMTFMQARVWGSEALLAEIWAKESPRSTRAVELRAKTLSAAGQDEAAYQWIKQSARANPAMRDLVLDLVLLRCHMGNLTSDEVLEAAAQLRHGHFNRSSLEAIATLQVKSQRGACGPALTPDWWQRLAGSMLANPSYAANRTHAAYLWFEIAKSRIAQRRLDANEALEASYAAQQDPQLALLAYELMRSSGQCELAERWRRRTTVNSSRGFDRWMQAIARPHMTPPAGECNPANAARSL